MFALFFLLCLAQVSGVRRSTSITNSGGLYFYELISKFCSTSSHLMACRCSIISLLFHRTRVKSRYILSIFVGLSLGFALSLACLPFMSVCDNPFSRFPEHYVPGLNYPNGNNTWLFSGRFDPFQLLNRQSRSVVDVTLVDYASVDYEPQIHSPQELLQLTDNKSQTISTKSTETTKIIRPRYIADELGIREKVLVAVLSETNRLNTFGLFINQTLQEHINRVLFFINEDSSDFPKGMQIVAVNDKRVYLRPFYVLKYLAEKMVKLYDWFFLVPDNTFIRGFKVRSTQFLSDFEKFVF